MKPTRFFITTRAPRDANDPGEGEFGHYLVEGDEVVLTDDSGSPLSGENVRRKLMAGQDARPVAASLLRQRLSRKASDFHRKLPYEWPSIA